MPADPPTALTWHQGPIAPLPRTVTPFLAETVQSYLDRLAHANHLDGRQLRRYLTDQRAICCPRQDWLATASNHPLPILRARLIGLTDRDRDTSRQRRHARPACRLCMARRGVCQPVYCWFPDHLTVCRRHHRWIGPGAHTEDDQRDLRRAPAVIAAARRHTRLHRRHNDAARFAVKDATRILRWWSAATHSWALSAATADVDAYITAYPDLIDLATILANARRHIWNTAPATPARARAVDAVYARLAHRFPEHRDRTRPIEQWVHDQQLIAARRTSSIHEYWRCLPTKCDGAG